MAWTGQTFTLNQVLTSTQMNQLQADITAQAQGDSGAPKTELAAMDTDSVDQAQILSGAVHQSELDVTTEEDSTTNASRQLFSTSAGSYALSTTLKTSIVDTGGITGTEGIPTFSTTITTSYVHYVTLESPTGGSTTMYGETTFITSSPPFDMGDGEIPLFVWINLHTDGTMSVSSCDVPPWAYNGPTNIRPDSVKLINNPENPRHGQLLKTKLFKTIDEETGLITVEEREITHAHKNADMALIPHPFASRAAGDNILILDPPDTLELLELMKAGQSINELLHNDYLRINNEPISRAVPNGVTPSKYRWKNTQSKAGAIIKDKRLKQGPFAE